jgi:hypothetical protein
MVVDTTHSQTMFQLAMWLYLISDIELGTCPKMSSTHGDAVPKNKNM